MTRHSTSAACYCFRECYHRFPSLLFHAKGSWTQSVFIGAVACIGDFVNASDEGNVDVSTLAGLVLQPGFSFRYSVHHEQDCVAEILNRNREDCACTCSGQSIRPGPCPLQARDRRVRHRARKRRSASRPALCSRQGHASIYEACAHALQCSHGKRIYNGLMGTPDRNRVSLLRRPFIDAAYKPDEHASEA